MHRFFFKLCYFIFKTLYTKNSCVGLQRTKQNYSVFTSPNISVRQKNICNESGKAFQADVIVIEKKKNHFSDITQNDENHVLYLRLEWCLRIQTAGFGRHLIVIL